MSWGDWKPYVSVAERRNRARREMDVLRKRGVDIQPIEIAGRKIARTFWGEAWCDHLESFSDFENRLPRGRTYVRNGSVCHLSISEGAIEAKVSGSEIYEVRVEIETLPDATWKAVKRKCAGQIGSLLELLRGNLSDNIMEVVTDRKNGLFPKPGEMSFECDCPDWASMCKHVAAVLYGIGARLDDDPALLFHLRGVDHDELIGVDEQVAIPAVTSRGGGSKRIATDDLSDVFGIDLAPDEPDSSKPEKRSNPKRKAKKKASVKASPSAKKTPSPRRPSKKRGAKKGATKKPTAKKSTKKKPTKKTTAKKKAAKKTAAKKQTVKSTRESNARKSAGTSKSQKKKTTKTNAKAKTSRKKSAKGVKTATKTTRKTASKRKSPKTAVKKSGSSTKRKRSTKKA